MAIAWCFVTHASAQIHQIDEVFVTSNRTGQAIDAISSEVDVLKKSDLLLKGNASLSQALSSLPGVQSTAYGQHSVYIRGTDSRMTSLYIEGIRIESHDGSGIRLGGGVPWEMIPIDMADRLELVRGPASAIYGSDAMGGVVQLFTKTGSAGDKPQLSQSLGSNGFWQTTGQVSGRKENFDYAIQLSSNASNGYDMRPDMTHTPSKEDSSKQFGIMKLGYDLDSIHRLELVAFKTLQTYKTPPYTSGDTDITNHNHITGTGFQWQSLWNENHFSRWRLNQSEVAADSNDPNNGNDVPWNYKTTATTLAFDHEWGTAHGKFNMLLERKQDKFSADENYWGGFLSNTAVDQERAQNAMGVGYSHKLGQHLVNASWRADNYSNFGTHTSYSVSYGYEFHPEWTINAIESTGFRAPTLEQMYGYYGSTSLLPESNVSREFALQFRRADTHARLSLFENVISDLITSNAASTSCIYGSYCYYNVDSVKIQGASLSGKTQVSDIQLQASVDWLNPVYQAGTYAGNQLSLRSKNSAHFSIEKPLDSTRAGAELQYVGKRFDDAANTVQLPDYTLVNLWSKTSLNSEWTWINRIDNLFDRQYQQYGCTSGGVNSCNYMMPGVTFLTTVQWQPR